MGLAVGLKAELLLFEQLTDGATELVTASGQFRRQLGQAFARPPQRRRRIAPLAGLDQGQQVRQQTRVGDHQRLAATACPPHPTQNGGGLAGQLLEAATNRADRDARRLDTAAIPPYPVAVASVAASKRRSRSFRCGERAAKRSRSGLDQSSRTDPTATAPPKGGASRLYSPAQARRGAVHHRRYDINLVYVR